jgi:hypothetical protein
VAPARPRLRGYCLGETWLRRRLIELADLDDEES